MLPVMQNYKMKKREYAFHQETPQFFISHLMNLTSKYVLQTYKKSGTNLIINLIGTFKLITAAIGGHHIIPNLSNSAGPLNYINI